MERQESIKELNDELQKLLDERQCKRQEFELEQVRQESAHLRQVAQLQKDYEDKHQELAAAFEKLSTAYTEKSKVLEEVNNKCLELQSTNARLEGDARNFAAACKDMEHQIEGKKKVLDRLLEIEKIAREKDLPPVDRWCFELGEKEKRLISLIGEISITYPELRLDLGGIE